MTHGAVRQVTGHQVSAVDLVTVEVRRSILHGVLAPGQRVSVAGLARELGVSHIPVREALRRLENQGLIELNHARSAVVVPLSLQDLQGIYALRVLIEPEIAARSARLQTESSIARMAGLIATFEDVDPEVTWQAHQEFHLALVRPAASEWDLRTLTQLWAAAERYTRLVFDFAEIVETERDRRERIHSDILDAVRAGDRAATRRSVMAHLKANEAEIVEQLAPAVPTSERPGRSSA